MRGGTDPALGTSTQMTLRIFESSGGTGDTLALHGWLSAAEVSELERVGAAHGSPLTVDLAHLAGVDADGLQALVRLQAGGARLVGATPFVALLIEREQQEGASRGAARNGGEW